MFEAEEQVLWCALVHGPRPCFTPPLLDDLDQLQSCLQRMFRFAALHGETPMRALVWHSSRTDVCNLGGDLELFVRLIQARDRERLRAYAHACVDTVYHNWTKHHAPYVTIALVQGDALGGGFEAVLSNDLIIAERQSRFGLPEILFNMFPGMGAYSFLSRRLGGARAEAIITSGRLYSADEMADLGIVDLVVEPGQGVAAVENWLAHNRRRLGVLTRLSEVRRRCQPLSRDELIDVTEIWVDAALALEPPDLRKMERLARAQERRQGPQRLSAAAA